jgi:hypothetical protein
MTEKVRMMNLIDTLQRIMGYPVAERNRSALLLNKMPNDQVKEELRVLLIEAFQARADLNKYIDEAVKFFPEVTPE